MIDVIQNCKICGKHKSEIKEVPWTTQNDNKEWCIICKPCRENEIKEQIKAFEYEENDTDYCDNIICPYCGEEDTDSWEFTDDCGETTCGNCDNDFKYSRNVSVSYSTNKKQENDEE